MYLDRRHLLMQSFKGNLHHPQYLKKNMVEKISGSGLAFEDLKTVYSKFGKEGLMAILSKPPSSSTSPSPRVTKFGYSSQVLRRKHPALGKELNLSSFPFKTGEILRQ